MPQGIVGLERHSWHSIGSTIKPSPRTQDNHHNRELKLLEGLRLRNSKLAMEVSQFLTTEVRTLTSLFSEIQKTQREKWLNYKK